MNKKAKILKICMVFVVGGASAQKPDTLNLLKPTVNQTVQPVFIRPSSLNIPLLKQPVSPSYYAERLGFFCKQEIKLDKISTIPVRFRLGGVEACNKLEGKIR